MGIIKQIKDRCLRLMLGKDAVPSGLADLHCYFRTHGSIHFQVEKQEDGSLVAVSDNFLYGSIVTHADKEPELNKKIEDAILTAFEVPSSYAKDAGIRKVDDTEYAFA